MQCAPRPTHLVEVPELPGAAAAVGGGEQLLAGGGQLEGGGVGEGEAAHALGDLAWHQPLATDHSAAGEGLGARDLRAAHQGRAGGHGDQLWGVVVTGSSAAVTTHTSYSA